MAGWTQRLAETARRNRVELVEARLTRRDLAKLGLLTAAGYLVTKLGLSARAAGATRQVPESPATTPWVEELPIPEVARPCDISELGTNPSRDGRSFAGEAAREAHQHWDLYDPGSTDFHLFENRASGVRWHRELPPDACWCWNGQFPGPRVHARAGRAVLVRFRNQLPTLDLHRGYGHPGSSIHLHNGHVAAESDGDPLQRVEPGQWRDHLYLNRHAGFTHDALAPLGDPRETHCTLSYHDQSLGFGAQNTYRGSAGVYHLFNQFDSGDETDASPHAWRLPSGEFDVPLVLHDRVFDAHGRGYFDLFDLDGLVGDKVTVNGRIQPYLRVARRRYRLRVHNVGPSRCYELHLSNDQEMVQVARDGAMLPAPLSSKGLTLAVGQSVDLIVDFGVHPVGTRIQLLDLEERLPGGLPTGRQLPLGQGAGLLRFDVDGARGSLEDPSRVPERFFDMPPPEPTAASVTRTFVFEHAGAGWTMNGRAFDPDFMAATPRIGSAEVWNFVNRSTVWLDALQLHLEDHRVLSRDGQPPAAGEPLRGNVLRVSPGGSVSVLRRFRDFLGRYPMRSRHGALGDQGLMFMWKVVS